MYLIKNPWWLTKMYPSLTWRMPAEENDIFLTFDDGPHPTITPFVLDALETYNAKATFFCIGKNVEANQPVFHRILNEGHAIGNHTFNHFNGWKTDDKTYFDDVAKAKAIINSKLFRPPYGRISRFQIQQLSKLFNIIMWDVLSGDFDTTLSPEQCLKNVIANTRPGSIIVFHDSEKAFERLKHALPGALKHFSNQGYNYRTITR
ncbi:MAG TPA: polysaccharide deacetylase family protein [Pedobacter sp.]